MLVFILSALLGLAAVWGAPSAPALVKIDTSKMGPSYYKKPDSKVGLAVSALKAGSKVNPEEVGSYFEGDLLQTQESGGRSILTNTATRWPSNTLVYVLPTANFSATAINTIKNAMNTLAAQTCIKFKVRTNEAAYAEFINTPKGCYSTLGRTGARQYINLQEDGCLSQIGTTMHEIMHTLGFFHEHTRTDRDDFIRLNITNIQQPAMNNFNKDATTGNNAASTQGIAYDYGSVMHYGPYAFAIDVRNPTIIPKQTASIGQRTQLSAIDIQRIKAAYPC